MKYLEKEIKEGITLHLINTDKFKTNLIAIFLSTELSRENVTKNAVLTSVLRRGSMNFKTQEDISKKMEEMYGAEFDNGLDKIGKNHVLKFYIETVNDEYLPQNEENMLKTSLQILSEIVFNPLIINSGFDADYINQEKQNVKQIIEAKKDNKAMYAISRLMEELYKDEPQGLYRYGYVEDLENIDKKNLYEYYKELINNCKVDIFISGDIKEGEIQEIINDDENFKKLREREAKYCINEPTEKIKPRKEKNVEESMEVTQGKLVMGYDIVVSSEDLKNENLKYIGSVYNTILGGSANSKLFQNVREKESLAYTTKSSYIYSSGNILLSSGIDIPNYEKALEISKKQVEDMKKGDFSEEDINNAKKNIISGINSINDEQDTEIIYYLGQALSKKRNSLDEYIEKINSVTKEQIVNFANKIELNTVYFLKN